jgi:hypothetical protein
MKAAIAISRATIGDACKKDETIIKLQKDLSEVKCQFIKEASQLSVFIALSLAQSIKLIIKLAKKTCNDSKFFPLRF